MRINKTAFIEKTMDCKGGRGADAECRAEGIGPAPQMRHGTQIFQCMPLLLQRIIRGGQAFNFNGLCLNFKGLLCLGRQQQRAGYRNRRADVELCDFLVIRQPAFFKYDLNSLKIASVIQFNKSEGFGIPERTHPSADRDLSIRELRSLPIYFGNFRPFHILRPFCFRSAAVHCD